MAYSISVGVFDWVNFPKQKGFYPDDIPEDWKLAFYSNEFNTACLSLPEPGSRAEQIFEWVDDLPEEFELGLYIEHSAQIPIIQTLMQNDDCRISSLIVGPSAGNNLLHKEHLLSVLSAELAIYELDDLWSPNNSSTQNGQIALLPWAENMRQYREWIEQWLGSSELPPLVEHKTLWLQGADTSYQQLTEIRTLTELMGY
jgi:hypothetical protein